MWAGVATTNRYRAADALLGRNGIHAEASGQVRSFTFGERFAVGNSSVGLIVSRLIFERIVDEHKVLQPVAVNICGMQQADLVDGKNRGH